MATRCVSLVCINVALTLESVTGGSAGLMVESKLALPGVGGCATSRRLLRKFLFHLF
ncbi:hypothetical protein [Solidesulfovibrio sp. C21]|uniref:hypothetical protein n=1 Tax=Solidesulfovibrio sp. C21 TaxID=3398613 RepID=UPI0039FCB0D8